MGHPHLKTAAVRGEGGAVGRQGVEEGPGEIAAVDGGGQVADAGLAALLRSELP